MKKTQRQPREHREGKKRIAVAGMLLIATLALLGGTTIAWFTLSTAPEVRNIYTQIEANGNLEIALFTGADGAQVPESAVGDSGSNETWGNLIDFENASMYGLNQIVLKPAALRLNADGKLALKTPLSIPVYGSDGRIDFPGNSTTASYSVSDNAFTGSANGVRAIGLASGKSAQQIDYENALVTINAKLEEMQTQVSSSMSTGGGQLFSAVVEYGMYEEELGSASTRTYDISGVPAMLDSLEAANAALEAQLKAYFEASFATAAKDMDMTAYEAVQIWKADRTLATVMANGLSEGIYTVAAPLSDSQIAKAYAKYTQIGTAIANARTTVEEITSLAAASWDEVSSLLNIDGFFPKNGVKLNGFAITTNLDSDEEFKQAVIRDNGIKAQYSGGVYANLAAICGNCSAEIELTRVTVGGADLEGQTTNLDLTEANAPTIVISEALIITPRFSGIDSLQESDLYGYAIDLAIRTNAQNSHLLLQTEAIDRIDAERGTAATMGKGSKMTFLCNDTITVEQMGALMQSIRMVFTDELGTILGIGVLADAEIADGIVTGDIRLVQFSITDSTLTLSSSGGNYLYTDSAILTALSKNEMFRLSVYVYLDGTTVSNSTIINGDISMTGSINLQFASDADLIAMEYDFAS